MINEIRELNLNELESASGGYLCASPQSDIPPLGYPHAPSPQEVSPRAPGQNLGRSGERHGRPSETSAAR